MERDGEGTGWDRAFYRALTRSDVKAISRCEMEATCTHSKGRRLGSSVVLRHSLYVPTQDV